MKLQTKHLIGAIMFHSAFALFCIPAIYILQYPDVNIHTILIKFHWVYILGSMLVLSSLITMRAGANK
jgi:hypothetical protein